MPPMPWNVTGPAHRSVDRGSRAVCTATSERPAVQECARDWQTYFQSLRSKAAAARKRRSRSFLSHFSVVVSH